MIKSERSCKENHTHPIYLVRLCFDDSNDVRVRLGRFGCLVIEVGNLHLGIPGSDVSSHGFLLASLRSFRQVPQIRPIIAPARASYAGEVLICCGQSVKCQEMNDRLILT